MSKKIRLTNNIKKEILLNLKEKTHHQARDELDLLILEVVIKIRNEILGDDLKSFISMSKRGMDQQRNNMSFTLDDGSKTGRQYNVWSSIGLALWGNTYNYNVGTISIKSELIARYEKLTAEAGELSENWISLNSLTVSAMQSCRNVEMLKEAWPECVDYLPKFQDETSNLPAIQCENINEIIKKMAKKAA